MLRVIELVSYLILPSWFILHLVVKRPGIYLREIRKELRDFVGIEVEESTICKFLTKELYYQTENEDHSTTKG